MSSSGDDSNMLKLFGLYYTCWCLLNSMVQSELTPQLEPPAGANIDIPENSVNDIPNAISEAESDGYSPKNDISSNRDFHPNPINQNAVPSVQAGVILDKATSKVAADGNLSKDQTLFGLPDVTVDSDAAETDAVKMCRSIYDITCTDSEFRSANGSCNNLANPTWGMSGACYLRLEPADFADYVSAPRVSWSGDPLPNARKLSNSIHFQFDNPSPFSETLMLFGQFISHDINFTPSQAMVQCCNVDPPLDVACFPIEVADDDPFYGPLNVDCLEFVRSAPCATETCQVGPRIQMNQQTSYIDASTVYGSSTDESNSLRTFTGGTLKSQQSEVGELLPPSFNQTNDQCSIPAENQICFQAGDFRANQHPALTSMHTLWLRQHNRLAGKLAEANPTWDDETLYQKSRKILIGQLQSIVYKEYISAVVGYADYTNFYKLKPLSSGFTTYDPNLDATLHTEFSTAAYRFGHSMIQNDFSEVFPNGTITSIPLKDNFFCPFSLYKGAVEALLVGISGEDAQQADTHKVDAVRDFLYKPKDQEFGSDLAATNIQRGREHGVPGYIYFANRCNGIYIQSFDDLSGLMTPPTVQILKDNYSHVQDIDLFTGGLAETTIPNAALGPTFSCIVAFQFSRLKYGDRYHYEHGGQTGSFTSDQLDEIRATRLADIICLNSVGVDEVNSDAFVPNSAPLDCQDAQDIDATLY